MMAATDQHVPVLADEVLKYMAVKPGGRYIDGTVGAGGHASLILQAADDVSLLGLDRDDTALRTAANRLSSWSSQVALERAEYRQMSEVAAAQGWNQVDGILLDLGVSSMQIDQAERGFSFQNDGPLDMRMDRRQRMTASTVLNTLSPTELTQVFREYGDEPQAKRIANHLCRRAKQFPWERTAELASAIRTATGWRKPRRCPAVVRCFQALRILVNNELDGLEEVLTETLIPLLPPGGRLVIISFHSLEDRLVKEHFRHEATTCICPSDMPICTCEKEATLRILTKKVVRPTDEEIARNSRASCARLRAAERV